jgi:hypothetical protein
MNQKIFVHIGLPKTATTSLQTDFFPKLASGDIEYLGVVQPRNKPAQDSTYRTFLTALNRRQGIDELRKILSLKLKNQSLILSEEMITVSGARSTWKEKIANLNEILEGLDYEVIVTVREPAAALFSYYCEIYPKLGGKAGSFVECALESEIMHIFHYGKLITELLAHFTPERLHCFKFEDLIANGTRDIARLVTGSAAADHLALPGNRNQRPKTLDHVVTSHYFTFADYLCGILPKLKPSGKETFSKSRTRLLRLARKIRIRRIAIKVPTAEEMLRLRESLLDENRALEQWFGLKY